MNTINKKATRFLWRPGVNNRQKQKRRRWPLGGKPPWTYATATRSCGNELAVLMTFHKVMKRISNG